MFCHTGNATDFTLKEIVDHAPLLDNLAVWGCILVTRNHSRRKNLKVRLRAVLLLRQATSSFTPLFSGAGAADDACLGRLSVTTHERLCPAKDSAAGSRGLPSAGTTDELTRPSI